MNLQRSLVRREACSGRTRHHMLASTVSVIVLVLASLTLPTHVFATWLAPVSAEPPAKGHAEVIAQGVTSLPSGPLAWRAVDRVAEPVEDASPRNRRLGFVVANSAPVLVTESASNDRTHLSEGEAVFLRDSVEAAIASLSGERASYYALELVAAVDSDESDDGQILVLSDSFVPPIGNRDVYLVRDVLGEGETVELETSEAPIVVLATAGAIFVTINEDQGDSASLAKGEAATFDGAPTIQSDGADPAAFVAAVIGPEIQTQAGEEVGNGSLSSEEETPAPPALTEDEAVDSDGDGLTDDDENSLATNPENFDTDGDGLPDGLEVEFESDPTNEDTDRDGLADADEYELGTNPNGEDTDADGLADGEEVFRGYDPTNPDMDGDGLLDGEEDELGTNPFLFDGDEDGASDGEEVDFGSDPFDPTDAPCCEVPPDVDSDGDGLFDWEEENLGTDPSTSDSDGDGASDGQEVGAGTDPLDANDF